MFGTWVKVGNLEFLMTIPKLARATTNSEVANNDNPPPTLVDALVMRVVLALVS